MCIEHDLALRLESEPEEGRPGEEFIVVLWIPPAVIKDSLKSDRIRLCGERAMLGCVCNPRGVGLPDVADVYPTSIGNCHSGGSGGSP